MKLNLQEKIERDFPLNKRELALASGHTRAHLERLHDCPVRPAWQDNAIRVQKVPAKAD